MAVLPTCDNALVKPLTTPVNAPIEAEVVPKLTANDERTTPNALIDTVTELTAVPILVI